MTDATEMAARLARLTDAQRNLLARKLGLAAPERPVAEPVAVVGIGCRLPGGIDSPAAFWDALCAGRDLIGEVPAERWDAAEWYDADPAAPGVMNSRWGGFLDDVAGFDRAYFGIPADEAARMDPQQRILLETANAALTDAGVPASSLAGTRTGVYMASMTDDYTWLQTTDPASVTVHTGTGTQRSILANRLSHDLDLRGPSVALDTACSSSLVAVHLACQSIRAGESEIALAGGVNVMASPVTSVIYAKLGMLAADGRCKTFDASADGFVRGEGCGVVVLKRLSAAVRDGDAIWAVVRGTAIGQDGRTSSITAPSGPAQSAVIGHALDQAGVSPAEVSLVETHGTGTALGDPLELEALAAAVGADREDGRRCLLGAVKTNLGHLEAAAGVVGLIKTALSLHHGMVPPVLHQRQRNPRIDLTSTPFTIPTTPQPLPAGYAGISSFGFGGALAHAVLAPAPPAAPDRAPAHEGPALITVSARTPAALGELAAGYADQLSHGEVSLPDLAYTALLRRDPHPYRAAVVAATAAEAIEGLRRIPATVTPAMSTVDRASEDTRVALVFPGQGAVGRDTAARLYRDAPAFRAAVGECDEAFRAAMAWSPADALSGAGTPDLTDTRHAQAVQFTLQVALTAMWRSWGLAPAAVTGQSLGEVAAAHAAGALGLGDAVAVVTARAALMARLQGQGASAVVELGAEAAAELAARHGLSVAGRLAPTTTLVSGEPDAVRTLIDRLAADGVFTHELRTGGLAFHSPAMAALAPELRAALAGISPARPHTTMVSTVTGRSLDVPVDGTYWARNLAEPFTLPDAVAEVTARGIDCWAEVSAHPALSRSVRAVAGPELTIVPSLTRGEDELHGLLTSAGTLLSRGVPLDRAALAPTGSTVRLAGYPWQHETAWLPVRPVRRFPTGRAASHEAPVAEPVPASGTAEPPVAAEPAPATAATGQEDTVAATGVADELELALRGMWADVLVVEPGLIGSDSNFFDHGGNSLKGFSLVRRISEELDVRIPMDTIADLLTIRDLAAYIRSATTPDELARPETSTGPPPPTGAPDGTGSAGSAEGSGSAVPAATGAAVPPPGDGAPEPGPDRHEPFPLLPIQRAYWVGQGLELGGVSARHYLEYEMAEADVDRLAAAWNRLVRRHEMLRAVVDPDGRQRILPSVPEYRIEVGDLTGAAAAETEAALDRVRGRLCDPPRGSDEWPLFDLHATRMPGGTTRIHLTVDMLLCDGRSFAILSEEWRRLYEAPTARLEPLGLSFRDIVLEHLATTAAHTGPDPYWAPRLPDLPPPPQLPWARDPGELGTPRFVRRSARVDAERWERIRAASARSGLGASALLLTLYAEALATWSAAPEFCVNVTTFTLRAAHAAGDGVVGDFTSNVPVAVDAGSAPTLRERARRVQRRLWSDLEHVGRGGVELVAEANALRGDDAFRLGVPYVFTSLLAGDDGTGAPVPFGWLGRRVHSVAQTPQVLVDLQVMQDGGELVLDFDTIDDMFPDGLPGAVFDALVGLLGALADQPAAWETGPLALTPRRQLTARAAVNRTDAAIPAGGLHEPFLRRARTDPDAVAVAWGEHTVSYGDLDGASERVATRLEQHGVGRGDRVAVAMRKGWEQFAAVIGVHKAGAAYVPVDPDLPALRRRELVERTGAAVVLTQPAIADELEMPDGVAVLAVDGSREQPRERSSPAGDDLAYVIFTSGSTGVPKGVMVHHRAALNTVLDINARLGAGPGDAVLALSSLSFDLSVYDVFGLLAAGGTAVLPEHGRAQDPAHWADLAERHRVTLWNTVPALYGMYIELLEGAPPGRSRVSALRAVLLSGDWIPLTLPERSRAVLPDAGITSLGGATEAAVWSIHHPVGEPDPRWHSVPYGTPLTNQRFHVCNAAGLPCPDWVPGELYIAGVGVAQGYLGEAERTAAAFVMDPHTGERRYRTGDLGRYTPDGIIEFLGRRDHQVKVQGHRIELGEIEAALLTVPGVAEAAAVVLGARDARRALAAHVVAAEPGSTPRSVREHLTRRLPGYMVPPTVTFWERLPLTGNGKIDRGALVAAGADEDAGSGTVAGAGFVDAAGPVEIALARIWRDVLGVERIGVHDRFFELGGDSILSIQVVSRASREGIRLSPRNLFEHQTIAELAAVAGKAPAVSGAEVTVDGDDAEGIPLTPIQRWFFALELENPAHFNQSLLLEPERGALDPDRLTAAIAAVAERHDAFRLRFRRDAEGTWTQVRADRPGVAVGRIEVTGHDRYGIEAAAERENAMLDLAEGPVARALLVLDGSGCTALLLAVHHLVVDGVSWRVLLDDLALAYQGGELPPPPARFSGHARAQAARAEDPELRERVPHWQRYLDAAPLVPVAAGPERDADSVSRSLGTGETAALLTRAGAAYRTRVDELLLTALAMTAGGDAGSGPLRVDVEGHGREAGELADTVGWFTTVTPAVLDLAGIDPDAEPGRAMATVKEQLRAAPGRPGDFGLLRHGPRRDWPAGPDPVPAAAIVFNYLGRLDGIGGGLLRIADGQDGRSRDPVNRRPWPVEIDCRVLDGRFEVAWTYDSAVHDRAAAEQAVDTFVAAVRALVHHCTGPGAGGYTPSDFPLAELSDETLAIVLEQFREAQPADDEEETAP
ncbi:hypothetical protein CFN78_18410 [Amycolatopsis antarctica]|uniref:Phenyloxazoline synthase MbtB n=1 Tax=Amycolatopsis antarctica TaxID=1854586 RepID=A0A263D049_9PSEU|nr:hybrid non-ribosomal peptide synthetase/type I polyketide synthase [Amycolatopsis antarctica]OZM71802.1 hypothetical protein CFN78_18410 [Amycolatopsis antarctica]